MKNNSKYTRTEPSEETQFSFKHLLKTSKVPKGFWNNYLKDKQDLFLTQIHEQIQMVHNQKKFYITTDRKKREKKIANILDNTTKSIHNMKIQAKRLKQSQEYLQGNFTHFAISNQPDDKLIISNYPSTARLHTSVGKKLEFKEFEDALYKNQQMINEFKKPIENQKTVMQNGLISQAGLFHKLNKEIKEKQEQLTIINQQINEFNQIIIGNSQTYIETPQIKQIKQQIQNQLDELEYSHYKQKILQSMLIDRSNDLTAQIIPYTVDFNLYKQAQIILTKEAEKLSQHSYSLDSLKRKIDENTDQIKFYKNINNKQQSNVNIMLVNYKSQKFTKSVIKDFEHTKKEIAIQELQKQNEDLDEVKLSLEREKRILISDLERKRRANLCVKDAKDSLELISRINNEINQILNRLEQLQLDKEIIQQEIQNLEDEHQLRNLNIQKNQTEFVNPDIKPIEKQLKKTLFLRQNSISLDSQLHNALELIYNKLAKIMRIYQPFNHQNLHYLAKILIRSY